MRRPSMHVYAQIGVTNGSNFLTYGDNCMSDQTMAAGFAKAFLDYAVDEGAPRESLLLAAGLEENDLADQDARIPTQAYHRMIAAGIEATGDTSLLLRHVLDSRLEQMLMQAVDSDGGGIEPTLIDGMIEQVGSVSGTMEAAGTTPVLLVASNIRSFLSRLLRGRMANFYILAYEEVPADKKVKVISTVGGANNAAITGT